MIYDTPSGYTTTSQLMPVELLQVIAQPCYSSRLRYRSDYERNQTRQGTLRSENNPNYSSPAIQIPSAYLNDTSKRYYVRVCLVTVFHERTRLHYIHPYELEDTRNPEYNISANKCVWFPVEGRGVDFIKTFPNLRVVKRTAEDLKNYGDLQVLDSPDGFSINQPAGPKDTIKEFNLERAHLAFTMGQQIILNGVPQYIPFTNTTVLSDLLIEKPGRSTDSDAATVEATAARLQPSKCTVYKYAPRTGYANAHTEVLMFFKNKLKTNKCGELEITFEYHTSDIHWSQPALNLKVEGQLVSFQTPIFPYPVTHTITVDVLLKQRKREFEPLTFDYQPVSNICWQCQQNVGSSSQTTTNKRRLPDQQTATTNPSNIFFDDDDDDLSSLSSTNTTTTSRKRSFRKSSGKKQ